MNSLLQAAYHGVSVKSGTIYCTYSPCLICAKMILNVGLVRIVFEGTYPDPLALEMLQNASVELVRYAGEEVPT